MVCVWSHHVHITVLSLCLQVATQPSLFFSGRSYQMSFLISPPFLHAYPWRAKCYLCYFPPAPAFPFHASKVQLVLIVYGSVFMNWPPSQKFRCSHSAMLILTGEHRGVQGHRNMSPPVLRLWVDKATLNSMHMSFLQSAVSFWLLIFLGDLGILVCLRAQRQHPG